MKSELLRRAGAFLIVLGLLGTLVGCKRDPAAVRAKHYERGQEYFGTEKYREALIEFRNALKADPGFAPANYQLGLSYVKLGELPEAAKAFERTLELDPQHTDAALQLGEIYLMANAPGRSRELAEAILDREPENYSARVLLAKSYLGEKKFSQARLEFQKARDQQADDPAIHLALGIAEIGLGNHAAAEVNFKNALALDKNRIESYQNLANLYIGLKRPADAEQVLRAGVRNNPENTRIHLALADFYYRVGRLPQVESTLESVRKQAEDAVQIHSELGDFWMAHNQPSRSLPEYQASHSRRPSDVVKKKLVNAYITLGDTHEAARWNDEILQKDPNDHEGKMFRGAIAYFRGETASAIAQLEPIVAQDPGSVFARYYLGSSYLAQGRLEEARTQLYECIRFDDTFVHGYLRLAELSLRKNDPVSAAEYAKKVIALNPWMLEGYLLATDAALTRRDTNEAQRPLQVAQGLAPGHYLVHERWARLYTLKKSYVRAEREYQLALASSSRPVDTLSRLTRYYIERNQISQGLRAVNQYIDSNGASAPLYELLAQLYLAGGNWAEAEEVSDRAQALNPERHLALLYRGQALVRQGRFEDAIASYERASQVEPQSLPPYLLLADVYWQQGKYPRAIEVYGQALRVDPNSPVAQAGLAMALAEAGQEFDYALSLAQQAKQQRPEESVISDALAWVYHKKGFNNLAIPMLRECVAKEPENPIFLYHLAMAYISSGEKHKAQGLLEAALRNGLAGPYAMPARQAVTALAQP